MCGLGSLFAAKKVDGCSNFTGRSGICLSMPVCLRLQMRSAWGYQSNGESLAYVDIGMRFDAVGYTSRDIIERSLACS